MKLKRVLDKAPFLGSLAAWESIVQKQEAVRQELQNVGPAHPAL